MLRENHSFSVASPTDAATASALLVDDGGRQWRVGENYLVRVDEPSRRLDRIPSHNAYWFGWYSYYPQTAIYTPNP